MPLIPDKNYENLLEVNDSDMECPNRPERSLSTEEIFRGFEKIPLVLCQRIDITPYLDKLQQRKPPDLEDSERPKTPNNEAMSKILKDCSVVLVRDDLYRLKELLRQQSEQMKCKICDKGYYNERKLNNHLENKHMIIKTPKRVSFSEQIIIHEVQEYHRCRKCPKIFEDYNTLKLHMRQNHKKRKCYICHYCNKDFMDRTFFKVHIKLHCDACGLLVKNRKEYLEHREKVCRITKKIECKTCLKTFFHFLDLKDHSYDHLGTFYVCDICKDSFQTKCEVAHHIVLSHSKVRPASSYTKLSDKFTCNFCNLSCDVLEDMESHVANLPDLQNRETTDYKDYHFCDQCYRKFGTESDLLQHKWSHFLKNSDNSQTREYIEEPEILDKRSEIKTTYSVSEELPLKLRPKLVLKKIELPKKVKVKHLPICPENFINKTNLTMGQLKKPIIDPITKKTILSKHQCQKCGKYLSSNYCLTRHLKEVHSIRKTTQDGNLQCYICEEVFYSPSLLHTHLCIRGHLPEETLGDVRPDIYFNNLEESFHSNSDDDFMNMDYDIVSPIVQLTEYENLNIVVNNGNGHLDVIENKMSTVNGLKHKAVLQEVPIEF